MDLEVFVVLHSVPTLEIAGVEARVEADSRLLTMREFYSRRASGFGTFLERKEFDHLGLSSVADLLLRLPGLRTDRGTRLFGGSLVRSAELFYTRGTISCRPSLWLDGIQVALGGVDGPGLRVDDWVHLGDVAGVEFYRGPASVPAEFGRGGGCAAVVIWTRDVET